MELKYMGCTRLTVWSGWASAIQIENMFQGNEFFSHVIWLCFCTLSHATHWKRRGASGRVQNDSRKILSVSLTVKKRHSVRLTTEVFYIIFIVSLLSMFSFEFLVFARRLLCCAKTHQPNEDVIREDPEQKQQKFFIFLLFVPNEAVSKQTLTKKRMKKKRGKRKSITNGRKNASFKLKQEIRKE